MKVGPEAYIIMIIYFHSKNNMLQTRIINRFLTIVFPRDVLYEQFTTPFIYGQATDSIDKYNNYPRKLLYNHHDGVSVR